MPNHVTSKCTVTGAADEIARLRTLIVKPAPANHSDAGGEMFDFDAVVPMPDILSKAEESSVAEEGMALIAARGSTAAPFANLGLYQSRIEWIRSEAGLPSNAAISDVAAAFLTKNPRWEEQGKIRMQALTETGCASWYPWAIKHWGTKWGAYRFADESGEDGFTFRFETAWSFPTPIFEALADRFPSLTFDCICFDEGWNFAGVGCFHGRDHTFAKVPATDALYETVYGCKPEHDDEDSEDEGVTA